MEVINGHIETDVSSGGTETESSEEEEVNEASGPDDEPVNGASGPDNEEENGASSPENATEVLTVSEAKGMLRDIITFCERRPHKKQLAEARARAKGDPRAAMLSVVPMVVEVAEEALARRAKNKQQAATHKPGQSHAPKASREPLLGTLLRDAQFLVGADASGKMKKDMAALRSLLSPP